VKQIFENITSGRFSDEIIKMIIYEVCVKKFINAKHFKPPKTEEEDMWSYLIDFRSENFTRMHF
jgi:hypothetical protein